MRELRFTDWRDFQILCRFWMHHLVERAKQRSVTYFVYGNDGQGQGGVDLVPEDPSIGVVGQSKCWNTKVLTWAKIQAELRSTHDFPGLIQDYVILTTAPRHTSVQQQMPGDQCIYERPQGKFRVHIFYWDDLLSLDFIPQEELQRVFPRLLSLAKPAPLTGPSLADYSQSLQFARTFLPTLISKEHINWLATWDYTQGYVPAKYFDLFADLEIELDRTQRSIKNPGLRNWLNEGYRLQLSKCLPAAAPIFNAIESFAQAVGSNTVSVRMPDGGLAYGHGHAHVHASSAARIEQSWRIHAEALLAAYREVVDGASPSC